MYIVASELLQKMQSQLEIAIFAANSKLLRTFNAHGMYIESATNSDLKIPLQLGSQLQL